MPRLSNQKMKPLYLARILLEGTDDGHILTAQELCDALAAYDISASRQSIYGDIEALRLSGLDITLVPGKNGGYFIAKRDFELPELKLLVDAVQSSRLITGKKSRELIDKLSKLTSSAQAKQLNRQVWVNGRAKALNETVYYSIDTIHEAINDGKKISFKYFDYNVKKKRVYRKNGETYIRTPVAMCWNDDNYYLVAFSPKYEDSLTTFRVDRIAGVEILDEAADVFDRKKFSIADYIKRTFGMYSGEVVSAKLAFDESLVSVVLDHFGNNTTLLEIGGGRFAIDAEVSTSPVFLGWIFQFGRKAEILEPDSLRSAMRELVMTAKDIYGE
ncbi:transcriptional regulator [Clostridia bacterium]|nr:transcriptional regulator [Clostridia bacterium]